MLWTLAQYTFDSSTSPGALLESFCHGSYGRPGGDIVLDILRELDANSRGIHRIGYGNLSDTSAMLPDAFIARGRSELQKGVDGAQGKQQARLRNFQLTFEMLTQVSRPLP